MSGRRYHRSPGSVLVALSVLVACGSAHAVTGLVTDPDGKPVKQARVCHYGSGSELICASTDDSGRFRLLDNETLPIRIAADGYYYEMRPAVGDHEIVLRRAAILVVRFADAVTGNPIDEGELDVIYSSQKKFGPFPVNAAGVRIQRVLKPGNVRLIARAAGYRDPAPLSVELENGKQTERTVAFEPLPSE